MGRSIAEISYKDGETRFSLYCDTVDSIINDGLIESVSDNLRDYDTGNLQTPTTAYSGEHLHVVTIEVGSRKWQGLATKRKLIGPTQYSPFGDGEETYYRVKIAGCTHLSLGINDFGGLHFYDTPCGIETDDTPFDHEWWDWRRDNNTGDICKECLCALSEDYELKNKLWNK